MYQYYVMCINVLFQSDIKSNNPLWRQLFHSRGAISLALAVKKCSPNLIIVGSDDLDRRSMAPGIQKAKFHATIWDQWSLKHPHPWAAHMQRDGNAWEIIYLIWSGGSIRTITLNLLITVYWFGKARNFWDRTKPRSDPQPISNADSYQLHGSHG